MRLVAGIALAATLAVLTGCGTEPPPAVPSPTLTAEPLFESEEEALAAAKAAYEAYLSAYDGVLNGGGEGTEDLTEVLDGAALDAALLDVADFAQRGFKTVGKRTIENSVLQSFDDAQVRIYVCENLAEVDVVDESGGSLVAEDRPDLQAFEVGIDSRELLVEQRDARNSEGVCIE